MLFEELNEDEKHQLLTMSESVFRAEILLTLQAIHSTLIDTNKEIDAVWHRIDDLVGIS